MSNILVAATYEAAGLCVGLSVGGDRRPTWRMYDWRWAEGENHFRKALQLSPGDASVHWLYAYVLPCLGRFDEALDHQHTAQSLDPLSQFPVAGEMWTLYLAGRYSEGVKVGQRALARDSAYAVTWLNLALCHAELGHFDESVRCARRGIELSEVPWGKVILGSVYARAGRMEEARKEFRRLGESPGRVQFLYRARAHLALGEKEPALELLQRAVADHEEELATLRVDPAFRSLYGDPRFEALAARVGL